jgi:hypothetical protein
MMIGFQMKSEVDKVVVIRAYFLAKVHSQVFISDQALLKLKSRFLTSAGVSLASTLNTLNFTGSPDVSCVV